VTDDRNKLAYNHGRQQYIAWTRFGGSKEGVFLAGLAAWATDGARADYEDGWIEDRKASER